MRLGFALSIAFVRETGLDVLLARVQRIADVLERHDTTLPVAARRAASSRASGAATRAPTS